MCELTLKEYPNQKKPRLTQRLVGSYVFAFSYICSPNSGYPIFLIFADWLPKQVQNDCIGLLLFQFDNPGKGFIEVPK